ncbi:MAG: nitroreductase family protein [Candidatus Aenigmarchaeota archaeon]|nr:nitroreductase family protein [Candidatus Aenigmarchaeota archaeon]
MELTKAIKGRRSIRRFKQKKVPFRVIKEIIDAAQWAPSACNKQAWSFIVIDDEKTKRELVNEAGSCHHYLNTPIIIYVLYDKRINPEHHANIQSASAAIQNMILKAHELGLGTCWLASLGDIEKTRKILNIPKNQIIVASILLGFPDESPKSPLRRDVNEIIHIKKYVSETESHNLDDWSFEKVGDFASRSIRSTSPILGGKPSFPKEDKKIIEKFMEDIPENLTVLNWFGYPGHFLFALAKSRPKQKFITIEFSNEIIEWMKKRQEHLKIKNIKYMKYPNLPQKADINLMHETINRLPNFEDFLKKARRIAPRTILTIVNSRSFYGYFYSKTSGKIIPHFGPMKLQNINNIKKLINSTEFRIRSDIGFNLLASTKKIKQKSNKFKFLPNTDYLEGYATKSILKGICRIRFIELE